MKSLKTYVLAITCALGSLCSAAAAATLTPARLKLARSARQRRQILIRLAPTQAMFSTSH